LSKLKISHLTMHW